MAISGCTGNLPFVENADIHYAQSGIFTPADVEFARDAVAARCNPNVETMIIHDVDLELLRHTPRTKSVKTGTIAAKISIRCDTLRPANARWMFRGRLRLEGACARGRCGTLLDRCAARTLRLTDLADLTLAEK
ncbi:MAG: hypothetical protein R3C28_27460 [Pirellulaceae bacterium]